MEKIIHYFLNYSTEIIFTLIYASGLSVIGVFLILRQSALFGLVLSKVSAVSFILGYGLHGIIDNHNAFDFINETNSANLAEELSALDMVVVPVLMVLLFGVSLLKVFGLRNFQRSSSETFFTLSIILLTVSLPMFYTIFGANQQIMSRIYFTDLLYTPKTLFVYYLPHYILAMLLFGIFSPFFYRNHFDWVLAKIQGQKINLIETCFYVLCGFVLALCGKILGIYFSLAITLIPAFLALRLFSRFQSVFLATVLFSVFFSLTGFFTIFLWDSLPSEPLMILQMAAIVLLVFVGQALKSLGPQK